MAVNTSLPFVRCFTLRSIDALAQVGLVEVSPAILVHGNSNSTVYDSCTHLERHVSQLAREMPGIQDLTPAQVDRIGEGVLVDELKAEMHRAIVAERVDWKAEREAFLYDCKSTHTRRPMHARWISSPNGWGCTTYRRRTSRRASQTTLSISAS